MFLQYLDYPSQLSFVEEQTNYQKWDERGTLRCEVGECVCVWGEKENESCSAKAYVIMLS